MINQEGFAQALTQIIEESHKLRRSKTGDETFLDVINEENDLVIGVNAYSTRTNYECILSTIFETTRFGRVLMVDNSYLCWYASGMNTGSCISVGSSATIINSFDEGRVIEEGCGYLALGRARYS